MAKKIMLWVVIGILALGVIGWFALSILIEPTEGTIIPNQCEITNEGSVFNSYTCPSDKDNCRVSVTLNCDTQVTDPRVVFRGSSDATLPSQIAVDTNNDGALEPYIRGTAFSSGCNLNNIIVSLPEPRQQNYVYVYNSKVYICDYLEGKGYRYEIGGSISTQNTPLSTELCDGSLGFIRCAGTQPTYECSEQVTGDKTVNVVYSGYKEGSKTETFTLNGGQTVYWNGRISYEEIDLQQSECTASVKGSTPQSYFECVLNEDGCGIKSDTEKYCTPAGYVFDEQKQQCIPPFTVNIEIEKSIISTSETFEVDFELTDTNNNKVIPITATLKKGSAVISTITQNTGDNYINVGKTHFSINAPPTGYYTLTISFANSDSDFTKDYNVQVTEDLSVFLTTDNPVQFDNSPIYVYLKSFKSGTAKPLTNFEIEALYNGIKQYQYTTQNTNLGIIKIIFSSLNGDGTLRVKARGQDDSGLWTDWTDYFDVTVKKTTILFTTDFPTDECVGTQTLKFETKDSLNEYADTQNQVEINKPLGGKDYVTPSGSAGKYSFSYNFQEGGVYTVRITSTNSQLGTAQLNSGQGTIVNVLAGDSCGGGGGGGDDGINWTLWIIVIIFALAIGIFVYFVFFKKKR